MSTNGGGDWLRAIRRELIPLAALALIAGTGLAFLKIAGEVGEGETHALDRAVLVALRTPGDLGRPIGPAWLKVAAIDLTSFGSLAVLSVMVLMVSGFFASLRRFREALALLVAAGGGLMLSQVLKAFFGRARPDAVFQVVPTINASFPSGHAMLSAVVFLSLGVTVARYAQQRRVKAYALTCAIALTLVVGASRVYLGVHWPTDVLAGWCLGAAWASAVWLGEWALERLRPSSPSAGSYRP